MNPLGFVAAGILAVAIILIAYSVAGTSPGATIDTRISRYGSARKVQAERGPREFTSVLRGRTFTTLNKAVEQRDIGSSIARELAMADLRLRVSEYMLIWLGAIVGIPAGLYALSLVVTGLRSPIVLVVGVVVGLWLPRFWLSHRRSARLRAFNAQLPDTITLVANSLRSGSSFLQAIDLVVRESTPPVTVEFSRVIREVSLGLPFDSALENMVRRVRSDDLELMATAISIQHQVGGNLAEILDTISFTIRDRIRIKGEIRTLTAQQRLSGYVLALLPIGLGAFLLVAAPQFMKPMFVNPPGIAGIPLGVVFLSFAALLMGLGFIIIRKIVDIDV